MTGWIRKRSIQSKITKTVEVLSYDAPIESANGEEGTIITKKLDEDISYGYIQIGDYIWSITGCESNDSATTILSVVTVPSAITNGYSYDRVTSTSTAKPSITINDLTGNTLFVAHINTAWEVMSYNKGNGKTQDFKNRLVQLGVTPEDLGLEWTAYQKTGNSQYTHFFVSDGKTTFDKYKELFKVQMIRKGKHNYWTIDLEDRETETAIPVYFNDGHSTIISETFDNDIVSRIYVKSTYNETDPNVEGFEPIIVGYLASDGTAVYGGSGVPLQGYPTVYEIDYSIDDYYDSRLKTELEEIFAQNSYRHRVEFYSDKELHIEQPVKLMLDRGVLDTAISCVYASSNEDRFRYVCGELPTTISSKIHAHGWRYERRIPHAPYKGQLVLV